MFPGQLPTGLFDRYLTVIETGEPWIGEVHYHRDGVNLLVRLAVARVGNGVAVSIVDISERYRAEQALKLADRQKDEFLAMLAHELRNPLAPIRNASELLSRMKGANAQERNVIEIVRRQSAHLSRLVDDLLDVSRITQGRIELRRETLLLADVIRQAIEGVEPIAREKRHDLRIRSSYLPLYVNGDFARLVQCVVNLLTNSAKYTDPGGVIDVALQEIDGFAIIEIKDNGIGIAPELQPRIFDLFVQSARSLDRSQGGLGIGLSVVQRLVEMHGGTVTAHSEGSMRGSTFTLRLPLTEAPMANKVKAAPAPVAGKRILIVDDNEDAAETLAMMLSLDGHEARTAFDGAVALSKVRDWTPDIVLLDIGLPGMDGYEVARQLRNDPSIGNIRLIALTGYGQPEDKQRAIDSGFDAHLVKPIAPELLAEALR
jgi:signal transduction histidine kinase